MRSGLLALTLIGVCGQEVDHPLMIFTLIFQSPQVTTKGKTQNTTSETLVYLVRC